MKNLYRIVSVLIIACLSSARAEVPEAMDPRMPHILSLEERAAVTDAWLKERLDAIVGPLMRREGAQMWILVAGEYNEDPVAKTMLPATWLSARRTTVLVFFHDRENDTVERLAVARYPVADIFPSAWDPETQPDQWKRLGEIVAERDPETIAVNVSKTFPLADGLSAAMEREVRGALGDYADRLIERPGLALGWLETRIPAEMEAYPTVVRIAHAIIAETFSESSMTPGVTTTNDLRWRLRQRVADLGLDVWFHPSVHIQRRKDEAFSIQNMGLDEGEVIRPGDFLHLDFGITYLRLNTDTQHHAYVLRPGETQAPKGLRDGLAAANKVQDALTREFAVGLTGNELLTRARRRALRSVKKPSIYSHPIGYHGHGAGPWVGMWDNQETAGARGDRPVYPNTAWSIELNAEADVPEWDGQSVRFMTEEDAYFDGETVRYLDGRQTEITLIPRLDALRR